MTARETRAILDALQAKGTVVRFVGGCVRDAVLGRSAKDIDIATPDPPKAVMKLLRKAGLKVVPTGLQHGTVTGVADHHPFEITTLREDVETDGRRADVAFTDSWIADASRRDFTMNAMFCDADGTLYDPFDGRADLLAGRVRFVGEAEQRIREDYLRLLRFFRFHAHYGRGDPDPAGLAAAARHAEGLAGLSAERVRDELFKLLVAAEPAPVVRLMHRHAILTAVLPHHIDADRLAALAAIESRHDLNADPLRRLAASFDLERDTADALARRLRLSRHQRKRLGRMVADDASDPAPDAPGHALRVALYRIGRQIVYDRVLLAAAAREAAGDRVDPDALAVVLADIDAWRPKHLPVTGADVRAQGVKPGPRVGMILRDLEAWWIARDFQPDRVECLARLDALMGSDRG